MGVESIIILILAAGFGFYMAWNIGTNDVASAMDTSVGSGPLTLKKPLSLPPFLSLRVHSWLDLM